MPFALRALPLSLILLLACAAAQAQGVNKCTINGKVVYQSEPCPAGGASGTVRVDRAPTAEEVERARAIAVKDRQRMGALNDARPATPAAAPATAAAPKPADCAALNQKYAEAWGRRNAYTRSGVSVSGTTPDRTQEDIERAKAAVLRAGCKLE
jgi:hypothetical protein